MKRHIAFAPGILMFLEKESQRDWELIFEKLFEVSPFLMGIVKLKEGTIVHLLDNQATCDFFQKKRSAAAGSKAEDMGAAQEYIELWKTNYLKSLQSKQPVSFEYLHRIFGEDRYLKANVSFLGLAEDTCPLFFYLAEDITDEKILTKKLEAEKARFREATENANAGLLDWNVETGDVFFSEKWKHMLGYSQQDFLPEIDSWLNKVHEDDQDLMMNAIQKCLEGNVSFFRQEYRMRQKSGDFLWMLAQGNCVRDSDHKVKHIYIWNSEIHQMKLMNTFLELEREKFEAITNHLSSVIWISDPKKSRIEYISKGYERIWKQSIETLYQNPVAFIDPIHPEDKDRVIAAFPLQILGRYDIRYRLLIKGEVTWIHDIAFPIRDENGDVSRVVGIATDITKDIERENTLLLEKEKFESIVENIPVMLSFFDEKGEFQWCNKEWEVKLGWNSESMKGQDILSEFYPDEKEKKRVLDFMLSGRRDWEEFLTRTKDGKFLPTIWANVRLSSGASIGIGKDISQEKEQERIIEEQRALMVHSSRLSTLGEMAGGVAHEVNNPLSIILGKTNQLKKKIQSGDVQPQTILDSLAVIEKTADRIGKIVKGLKLFSRSGEGEPFQPYPFSSILQETLDLCSERLRQKQIQLVLKVEPTIVLECRNVQISQILLNLISNSLDAIQFRENPWIEIGAHQEKDRLIVYVTDSGLGIPQEIASKLMIPFFTTKELGKGTGLGLSISRSLAEDHGGTLIYDEKSPNTRFVLTLPVRQKEKPFPKK